MGSHNMVDFSSALHKTDASYDPHISIMNIKVEAAAVAKCDTICSHARLCNNTTLCDALKCSCYALKCTCMSDAVFTDMSSKVID